MTIYRRLTDTPGWAVWFSIPFTFNGRTFARGYIVGMGAERFGMTEHQFRVKFTTVGKGAL